MILPLSAAVTSSCGGKAGTLGTLLRHGLPVPDGFVVPFDAHTSESLSIPDQLLDAIAHGLDELGDTPVAVRSSADTEDTVHGSGAGQHDTTLAVHGVTEVCDAIRTSWASLHSRRAVGYREAVGQSPGNPTMAVLVQRLVDAEVSGVMFTPAGPHGTTEVEASWGLGPSVVQGAVTPDAYRVTADGSITGTIASKQTRLDRIGSQLVSSSVPERSRHRPTLDDRTITRLTRLGHEIAAVLDVPQDIEWAIDGDRIRILQARPITATAPASSGSPVASPGTFTGTPGSVGTVTGTARIVGGPDDFTRVHVGDVLICPYTDPAWTPLLRIAAGVVTEVGGALSHAAIVARELSIPAVLGIPQATATIPDGTQVTIDGAAGAVTTTVS